MNYATFEGHPCVYDEREAWVRYGSDGWRKQQPAEIIQFARPISEAEFKKLFPDEPAIPSAAFQAGE